MNPERTRETAPERVKQLWTTNRDNSYNGAINDAVRALEAAAEHEEGSQP